MNKSVQILQDRQFLKDASGWGFVLWLIGYALGFVFFAIAPPDMIGWRLCLLELLSLYGFYLKKLKEIHFCIIYFWQLHGRLSRSYLIIFFWCNY